MNSLCVILFQSEIYERSLVLLLLSRSASAVLSSFEIFSGRGPAESRQNVSEATGTYITVASLKLLELKMITNKVLSTTYC